MRSSIQLCDRCNNLSEGPLCHLCSDPRRDPSMVCVVEQPSDIVAVERTRQYNGQYHVLHGALSPIKNIRIEDLKIKNLLERLEEGTLKEVIIATSPTTEGQATASYLVRLLKPLGVRLTRIGMGVPIGTELEYVDEATMMQAMDSRREL